MSASLMLQPVDLFDNPILMQASVERNSFWSFWTVSEQKNGQNDWFWSFWNVFFEVDLKWLAVLNRC